ncbi:MAG: hypothetical protein KJP25_04260 [Gammaproteobacteria bacterium]|nr:hypothetical protein [Gammaproteobacteria bacterium]NND40194.1 ShlB/FhaC/HecB family hemolysin secretion/activation protein [Pseudomonadales bacterium]NNM11530.1 ShlB/FhaC/HecB family hemolysin secretion/activation protein [Pseudomonadales bacterium]RZV56749.1 MAG: ShlB/FhaC/HecB family hemolysin secretion/activation protein [Pseudomonadales bacterium]
MLASTIFSSAIAQVPVDPGAIEPARPAPAVPDQTDDPIQVPATPERAGGNTLGPKISVTAFELAWEEPEAIGAASQAAATEMMRKFLQERDQRLTIAELDVAANALTDFLRGEGYLLAKAILPPQQVQDGSVRLRIFSAIVGDVAAKSNQLYSKQHITHAFRSLKGAPVQRQTLEPRLLLLNELPGQSAVAVFEPGAETGTTTLGLQTTREEPVRYSARVDNHGIDSTGDWRVGLGARVNNFSGNRDALYVDAIKTFSPGDLRNARLRYEITLPSLVHTLGIGFSETRYDVEAPAIKAQNFEGDTEIANLTLLSRWFNSRELSVRSEVGVATKRAEVLQANNSLGVDRLSVLSARVIAEGVDQRLRGVYRASLGLSRGFNDVLGSLDGADSSLTKAPGSQNLAGQFRSISASYNRLQNLVANHQLLLLFSGQYSNDQLASLEKMSLGGPYNVRAYPTGEFTADRAIYSSLAWVISGGAFSEGIAFGEYAWSQVLELKLFADYGWAKNRNGAGGITRRELSGFGLGARLNLPGQRAFFDVSAAKPFAGKQADNGDDQQFWFQAGIDF